MRARTASETVTIAVGESMPSFSGRVRLADGAPVVDAWVKIAGVRRQKPIAFTDRDGRYRLTGLAPRTYSVKLERGTKKRYRVLLNAGRVTIASGDAVVSDLVVEPK